VLSQRCSWRRHRYATHCSTLQHTASHCITLHHTAPHCTTLHSRSCSACGHGTGTRYRWAHYLAKILKDQHATKFAILNDCRADFWENLPASTSLCDSSTTARTYNAAAAAAEGVLCVLPLGAVRISIYSITIYFIALQYVLLRISIYSIINLFQDFNICYYNIFQDFNIFHYNIFRFNMLVYWIRIHILHYKNICIATPWTHDAATVYGSAVHNIVAI